MTFTRWWGPFFSVRGRQRCKASQKVESSCTCVSEWSCSPLERAAPPLPPFLHLLLPFLLILSLSLSRKRLYRFLSCADGAVSFQLPDANIAATRARGWKGLPRSEDVEGFSPGPRSCPAITRQLTDPLDFANLSRMPLAHRSGSLVRSRDLFLGAASSGERYLWPPST